MQYIAKFILETKHLNEVFDKDGLQKNLQLALLNSDAIGLQ